MRECRSWPCVPKPNMFQAASQEVALDDAPVDWKRCVVCPRRSRAVACRRPNGTFAVTPLILDANFLFSSKIALGPWRLETVYYGSIACQVARRADTVCHLPCKPLHVYSLYDVRGHGKEGVQKKVHPSEALQYMSVLAHKSLCSFLAVADTLL